MLNVWNWNAHKNDQINYVLLWLILEHCFAVLVMGTARADVNQSGHESNYALRCRTLSSSVKIGSSPRSFRHLLKWLTADSLSLKYLSQRPQLNRLKSEWTRRWRLSSYAVQKRFGHSLQTYGFTSSWYRRECCVSSPRLANFSWQMSHVNQVPLLCDFSRWLRSCACHVKLSEQWLHEYGFAPVWRLTCFFSSEITLNSFPQWGQWYGVLSLCAWRICSFQLQDWINRLLHTEHLYGLSPVWTFMWRFTSPARLNVLLHTWHLYGFSSLWILLCISSAPDCRNCLPQTVHSNGFSPEWVRRCLAR